MSPRVVLLGCSVIAMVLPACSLSRALVEGEQAPADAGGQLDAGSDLDAGAPPDAQPIDAWVDPDVDAGQDAGVDAGQDAGQDAGPPPPRSCDDIYDEVSGYERCAERELECEFYAQLSGSSCAIVCAAHGGLCLTTYGEGPSSNCMRMGSARPCTDTHNDEICICTRIP